MVKEKVPVRPAGVQEAEKEADMEQMRQTCSDAIGNRFVEMLLPVL
jgi:hypothetical protein